MRAASGLGILLLSLIAAGCAPQSPENPDAEKTPPAAEGGHEASGAPGMVRIDPEMLRDLRLTTTQAELRDDAEGITVLGEIGVNEDAYAQVGPPIAARIVRVMASPGDPVRPGQPLAELQSTELGKARAAQLSARAQADLADQELERKRGLTAEKIAPVRELQEAEAKAKAAHAELEAAEAALQALGFGSSGPGSDASSFLLASPIAGIVLQRDATRGQMADPVAPLFRVADLSRLWLTVHAFERDAVRLAAGSAARVAFPALPGRKFPGKVTRIGSQVDTRSRTVPVRVELANETGMLLPGMSATAWIPVDGGGRRIVSVPSASLQRMQEGWCVFLPAADGLFTMRAVGRGRDLGGEVEILSGLQPGETVVVEGAFLLKAEAEKSRGAGEHHDH